MKKVSVIIPFYNGVDWLCEAVESVLKQTYDNIEIIVVNDGSKEDISDFLQKYGDKIIYEYQKNQGPAAARNRAMEIATGDYFAFLDSDDIWLPEKTEKQIAFMEERNIKWSHTGFYYWYPKSGKLKLIDNRTDFGDVSLKFLVSVRIATPSVVIEADIVRKNIDLRFPVEYRKGQDSKFFHSLSYLFPLGLIHEPLVKVRMRGNNSYALAIVRFSLKAKTYKKIKSDKSIPVIIRFIYSIYYLYSKLFGTSTNKFKEFVAKCCWSFPYALERLYLRRFAYSSEYSKYKI